MIREKFLKVSKKMLSYISYSAQCIAHSFIHLDAGYLQSHSFLDLLFQHRGNYILFCALFMKKEECLVQRNRTWLNFKDFFSFTRDLIVNLSEFIFDRLQNSLHTILTNSIQFPTFDCFRLQNFVQGFISLRDLIHKFQFILH